MTLHGCPYCQACSPTSIVHSQAKDAANKVDRTAEEVTEKYGLEAGLWKVFRGKGEDGKGKGIQAKDLLKRYGSAYLITSISLSVVSFGVCYILVSSGQHPPSPSSPHLLSPLSCNASVALLPRGVKKLLRTAILPGSGHELVFSHRHTIYSTGATGHPAVLIFGVTPLSVWC